MTDNLVESITLIANHPSVIKHLESHVAFPMKIEEWMVKRVLLAITLFYEEAKKNGVQSGNSQGNNKHTVKRRSKGVHQVSEK
jgi:hypothetical protein